MKSRLNHPKPLRLNSYSATGLFCVAFVIGCFLAGYFGGLLSNYF